MKKNGMNLKRPNSGIFVLYPLYGETVFINKMEDYYMNLRQV
jgi:hypothetical protein